MRVALFESYQQAEPSRQLLIQAGIPAEIHKESVLAKLWFVSNRRACVRLEVPAQHAERACQYLLELNPEFGCLKGAVRCPECKSTRVEYPQFTEKSLLTNLAVGLMAELLLVERQCYCEDCHCMWSKSRAKPRRPRAHAAPDYFLEKPK
jgi:predicted Zn-ribbon and HTH transcriptional regulator